MANGSVIEVLTALGVVDVMAGMLDEAEQRGYRRAMAEVTARGDNSEMCCVEGCDQTECPGRQQPEAAA